MLRIQSQIKRKIKEKYLAMMSAAFLETRSLFYGGIEGVR